MSGLAPSEWARYDYRDEPDLDRSEGYDACPWCGTEGCARCGSVFPVFKEPTC